MPSTRNLPYDTVIDRVPYATTPGDDPSNTHGRYPVPRSYASTTRAMASCASRRPITATVPPLPPPVMREPYNPFAVPSARIRLTRRSVPGDPSPHAP